MNEREEEKELLGCSYPMLISLAAGLLQTDQLKTDLDPQDLVHEAWLRLQRRIKRLEGEQTKFPVAYVRKVMQRVLIDTARSRDCKKRQMVDRKAHV